MKLRNIIFAIFSAAFCLQASAITLEEAKEAYSRGDYAEAAPVLKEAAVKEPRNSRLNLMAGVALMRSAQPREAEAFLRKAGADGRPYLAELAFNEYRFQDCLDILDEQREQASKSRRGKKRNAEPEPEDPQSAALREKAEMGLSMLDRVEKIAIIDSIDVDADEFFRVYRLAPAAGRILPASSLSADFKSDDNTTVYATENSDHLIWARPDKDENYRLMESSLLADGTWETPVPLGDNLAMGGDSNYPFLMSDGMTLYYASDGEGSLGGLDIFISRRDGTSFLQPTNLGFPYNSPANDYLLAIDEVTGAGWWATDRNAIPGKVTIYVFVPQELRINYPVDDPELADRARVTSIAATQQKDKDYSAIRNAIASIDTRPQKPRTSFNFGLPGGRVAHTFADFHNPESQALMNRYLTGCRELADTKARLARMRASYGKGDTSLSADILDTEREITDIRTRLADIANQIAKAEQ